MHFAFGLTLLALAHAPQDRTPVEPLPLPPAVIETQVTMAMYECRDIVMRGVLDAPEYADPVARAERKAELERMQQKEMQAFDKAVRTWITPPLVKDRDELRCLPSGTAILKGTDEQQQWLRSFLELQRTWRDAIAIDVRVLEAPRGGFARLGVHDSSKLFQSQAEAEELLERAKNEPDFDVLFAPKVVAWSWSEAEISATTEISYIQDWRLVFVEPGHQSIADPVIATIKEGDVVGVHGVLLERELYGIELDFVRTEVAQPIPTKSVRLTDDKQVEIALPEVAKVHLASSVKLAEGASVLFCAASTKKDRDLAVILTVHRMPRALIGTPR